MDRDCRTCKYNGTDDNKCYWCFRHDTELNQRYSKWQPKEDVTDTNVGKMTELERYKKAFSVACELLIGASLFGVTEETMFKEIMEKDGIVSSLGYEKYILDNLARLTGEDDGTAHGII